MKFIKDNFMLKNKTGYDLYHKYAKELPIIDYHCHLDPKQIAEDYKFKNAYDLFLGGDHYKWRQMRSNGVDEEYITGSAPDFEKFMMWAKTMPYLIGNPLYHWTHLELLRYFGIEDALTPENAKEVWDKCNEMLADDSFSAKNLITRSNVETICTTDDPADTLEYHTALKDFSTAVLPTFRPDKAIGIDKDTFIPYIEKIGVKSFSELLGWLGERVDYFDKVGCRLSDHSVETVPFALGDADKVFDKKLSGEQISAGEAEIYKTAVLAYCAKAYARHGWTMQLHIGALRNNNQRMFEKIGADTGFDSINDLCIAEKLSAFLNHLEYTDNLPKTILYTLNPKDNYVLATMMGNFQKAPDAAKVQFGSGWWFNDNRDGMEAQLSAFANLGLLGKFVGMLTDSRSFVSYPRHEYFRRILCNLIGRWVEEGEYPNDEKYLKEIVEGISYKNAKNYFKF